MPHPSASIHHPLGTAAAGPLHGPNATPPKAGPINKIRGVGGSPGTPTSAAGSPTGIRDTIPIAKTPRKQRSSRFHVTERPEIQRLPGFMGLSSLPLLLFKSNHTIWCSDVSYNDRHELFLQKLRQASVVFDFNDASTELAGKQIKTSTLQEMLEWISTQRGVITEAVYPEVVSMVSRMLLVF